MKGTSVEFTTTSVARQVRQSDGMIQAGPAAGSSRNAPAARDGRRFTGESRGNTPGAADAFACLDAGG
jgi:hypothetical protein